MAPTPFPTTVTLSLPAWLPETEPTAPLLTAEDRVRHALALARRNSNEGGGPFAAVLVERLTGRRLAAGVNRVVSDGQSIAHAEIMTIAAGQAAVASYDLHPLNVVLSVSCEPCAMCYGALLWSGVRAVEFAATGEDAAAIGFDEGEKPSDWIDACRRRGIEVTGPVLRAEGIAVLTDYAGAGHPIYNPGRDQG